MTLTIPTPPFPSTTSVAEGSRESSGDRTRRTRLTEDVTAALAEDPDGPDAEQLREHLVTLHLPVAASIAHRYGRRGVPVDDLQQVAYLALTLASRRFDAGSGHDFMSYCVPTIRGEIRRYFRDQGWTVRPPRRLQEIQMKAMDAENRLSTRLGRPPTTAEIAEEIGTSGDQVAEAMAVQGCFAPTSLDRAVGVDGTASLGDLLAADDQDHAESEARTTLGPAVRSLCDRDREILRLRFFDGCTQREIAEHLGVTQMHVSRLLSRIYRDLRARIGEVPDDERPVIVTQALAAAG